MIPTPTILESKKKELYELMTDYYLFCMTYPTPRERINANKKLFNWIITNFQPKDEK